MEKRQHECTVVHVQTTVNSKNEEKYIKPNDISKATFTAVNFSIDNKKLVLGSYDLDIRIWDTETSEIKAITNLTNETNEISEISLSPDGRKMLAGPAYGKKLVFVNLEDGKKKSMAYSFANQSSYFSQSHFLNDSTIITADYSGDILLWKIYPDFRNAKEAFENIRLSETKEEKLGLFRELIKQIDFNHFLQSEDIDTVYEAARAYYNDGVNNKKYLTQSKKLFLKLLVIDTINEHNSYLKSLVKINGELYTIENSNRPKGYDFNYYNGIVNLFKEKIKWQEKLAETDTVAADSRDISDNYGSLSFYSLFIKDYAGAVKFARQGIKLFAENDWILTNLALGYLLSHQFDEAMEIYKAYMDKYYSIGSKAFREAFLEDFRDLEVAGVISIADKAVYDQVNSIKAMLTAKPGSTLFKNKSE